MGGCCLKRDCVDCVDGSDGVVVLGVGGMYDHGLDSESWFNDGGHACQVDGK